MPIAKPKRLLRKHTGHSKHGPPSIHDLALNHTFHILRVLRDPKRIIPIVPALTQHIHIPFTPPHNTNIKTFPNTTFYSPPCPIPLDTLPTESPKKSPKHKPLPSATNHYTGFPALSLTLGGQQASKQGRLSLAASFLQLVQPLCEERIA